MPWWMPSVKSFNLKQPQVCIPCKAFTAKTLASEPIELWLWPMDGYNYGHGPYIRTLPYASRSNSNGSVVIIWAPYPYGPYVIITIKRFQTALERFPWNPLDGARKFANKGVRVGIKGKKYDPKPVWRFIHLVAWRVLLSNKRCIK